MTQQLARLHLIRAKVIIHDTTENLRVNWREAAKKLKLIIRILERLKSHTWNKAQYLETFASAKECIANEKQMAR